MYNKWILPEGYNERVKYANYHSSILESKMIEQKDFIEINDLNYIIMMNYYIKLLETKIEELQNGLI